MSADTRSNIENIFVATAFAEAGEFETVMRMAKITGRPKRLLDRVFKGLENHGAAVAYAEMDEHDEVRRWVKPEKEKGFRKNTLAEFLEQVGLENARFCYGIVPLRAE